MLDAYHLARAARRATVPLLWSALLAYLSYHAFVGERGIYTHHRLEGERVRLVEALDRLEAERARMELKVALLTGPDLDPDMLDERARAVLNYADPADIIILRKTD